MGDALVFTMASSKFSAVGLSSLCADVKNTCMMIESEDKQRTAKDMNMSLAESSTDAFVKPSSLVMPPSSSRPCQRLSQNSYVVDIWMVLARSKTIINHNDSQKHEYI